MGRTLKEHMSFLKNGSEMNEEREEFFFTIGSNKSRIMKSFARTGKKKN